MTTQAYECSILMLAAYEMMLPARLPKFKYEYHKSPTFKVYFHAPGYCLPAKRIWNETWRWIRIRPQRVCSHCQINSHAQMDTNEEPACCFSCYDYAASSSSAIYLVFCCKNLFDNVVSLVLGLAGQVEWIKRPFSFAMKPRKAIVRFIILIQNWSMEMRPGYQKKVSRVDIKVSADNKVSAGTWIQPEGFCLSLKVWSSHLIILFIFFWYV